MSRNEGDKDRARRRKRKEERLRDMRKTAIAEAATRGKKRRVAAPAA